MRARCRRNAKSRWTVSQSAVQFCRMWRVWVGLLLLATPVWAEENATAYEALRVVGRELGRDALHQIVSITGTKGDPQPEKWKIVVEDPQGRGVRELHVADGTIYIGGTRGTVRRTEGMFAGATMEDVEGDYDQGEVTGVIRSAKRSIKHGFNRAQEEARGMFEKVKRSFSDFINRE